MHEDNTMPHPISKTICGAVAALLFCVAADAGTIVRREAAGAFFEYRDASGCILTTVDISALREYLGDGATPAASTSLAETFMSRRDTCRNVELFRASESGAQSVTFTPYALNRAFLDGSFGLFDYVTNRLYEVVVHLQWEGEGATTRSDTPTQSHAVRGAIAVGSVMVNGENMTPGTSKSAAIERIRIRID
jgi:hypothetical protein